MVSQMAVIRRVYNFLTLGLPLGLVVAGTVALLTADEQYAPWRRPALGALVAAGLLAGVRVHATHLEPWRLAVRRVRIETPKLRQPLRLLHFSDIELPAVCRHERRAVARMRQLAPDLVISTGDLMQTIAPASIESELPKLTRLLATIAPPLGKWHVRGDSPDKPPVRDLASDGGLETLESESRSISTGHGQINILGLTLKESSGGRRTRDRVRRWLALAQPDEFTILAGHRPDFILDINDLPIDLCLAGHTHGGQVWIPFLGPPLTKSRVPRRWARGCRPVGRTRLNVSAGIGCDRNQGMPPLRFCCPPEMTLFELVPHRFCD